MTPPLDERYLVFLYSRVADAQEKDPNKTFWSLFKHMYSTEFVWFIPNDDNRVEDGRDLRHEFRNTQNTNWEDTEWMGMPCSLLEMVLGLANRLSFEADGSAKRWFWLMLKNAGLRRFTDASYARRGTAEKVEDILQALVFRGYDRSGQGGFFPLERPRRDQRKEELWYQLQAYLLERK